MNKIRVQKSAKTTQFAAEIFEKKKCNMRTIINIEVILIFKSDEYKIMSLLQSSLNYFIAINYIPLVYEIKLFHEIIK